MSKRIEKVLVMMIIWMMRMALAAAETKAKILLMKAVM